MFRTTALPTLGLLIETAVRTFRRFPLVLSSGLVAAVAAIFTLDDIGPEALQGRLLASASLGVPLFLAARLFVERRRRDAVWDVGLPTVGAVLLAGFYWGWEGWAEPVRVARYIQASAVCHLLVAVLPFVGRDERHGFWQYNKTLFLRFLTAALYTVVLYVGFAIALAAVDQLFAVDIPGEAYARLWAVATFVFNTWFFLAGIPRDLSALEDRRDYPAALSAFSRYALVPVVTIYLVILLTYLTKVLLTWDWPSGWIGYLVSSVAGVGMLALLLVHPVANDAENRWVRTFARTFYLVLLPAVVMLWLAIWQRIAQYGVTEPRYFLVVLSVWLFAIALYFVLTRSRRIIVIPTSLCVVGVLTLGGPWGPFRVSEWSQVRRLAGILAANGMLVDGRVQPAAGEVAFEDRREIAAVFRYLLETHGTDAVAPWFARPVGEIDTLAGGRSGRQVEDRTRLFMTHLEVDYVSRWQRVEDRSLRFFASWTDRAVPISGFDYLIHMGRERPQTTAPDGVSARFSRTQRAIIVRRGDVELFVVALDSVIAIARERPTGPRSEPRGEPIRLEASGPAGRVVIFVTSVEGHVGEEGPAVQVVTGEVLVSLAGSDEG